MIIPCIDKGGYRQFRFKTEKYIKDTQSYIDVYHNGRDRNCPEGTPVYAVKNGKVIFAGDLKGFGSFSGFGGVVMIQSDDNNHTILYGHLKLFVKKDDIITKGTLLGRVIKYEYNVYDKKTKKSYVVRADHLHWCDWIAGGIPTTKLGYVSLKELDLWADPNINLGV